MAKTAKKKSAKAATKRTTTKTTTKKTTRASTRPTSKSTKKKPTSRKVTAKKTAAKKSPAEPTSVVIAKADAESIAPESKRRGGDRRKIQRRRQIDPTTCERDYSNEEIEFMRAMDEYKRNNGRMFPTCSEILEVVRALGYVRQDPASQDTTTGDAVETEGESENLGNPAIAGEFEACMLTSIPTASSGPTHPTV